MAKYLALVGETGLGKTRYTYQYCCEAVGKSEVLLVRSLEDLRDYTGQRIVIFDDISFEYKKPELLIHLCDRYFDAPVRILRNSCKIKKDSIKFFTHNNYLAFTPFLATGEQRSAIARRLDIIEFTSTEEICRKVRETLTQLL